MQFEVIYQMRGDVVPLRHALTTTEEEAARGFCRDVRNFPDGTIHYVITCDDGRTIHDTRTAGLL